MKPHAAAKEAALVAERRQLWAELARLSSVVVGSFSERFSTCSRPGCVCHQGQRHGPRGYLTIATPQGPRQVYIRRALVARVREGVRQYRRWLAIAARLSAINLALWQQEDTHEPDREGVA